MDRYQSTASASRVTENGIIRQGPALSRRAVRRIVDLAFLALLEFEGVRGNEDWIIFVLCFAALLMMTGLVARTVSGRITYREGRGHRYVLVSFVEDALPGPLVLPGLRRVPPSKWRSLAKQHQSGGKLMLDPEGIAWHAGSKATPNQLIAGDFLLPWNAIEVVDIGDIPGKFRILGGAITIRLADGRGQLDGEFFGSRRLVLQALNETPLGRAASA
jgi:hypothetical protein